VISVCKMAQDELRSGQAEASAGTHHATATEAPSKFEPARFL